MKLAECRRLLNVSLSAAWTVSVNLYRKYQKDSANIIVSSISFYILLTFIPFALLSIYILGYVIDITNPGLHLAKFLKTVLPDPYNAFIVKRVLRELNVISLSKRLSGPLGLLFLFFFTTKLFSVIRPSFRIIFGKHPERFLRAKQKELFFAFIFSIVQAMVFFSFIFGVVIRTKVVAMLPVFLSKTPVLFMFSLLDFALTFVMFYLLYYFLTPVRKLKKHIIIPSAAGTILWHLGKFLFKYYILRIGKFTALFGTFGIFIAFLFWIYFSVFVFIVCAELESILISRANRGPAPSSSRRQGKPSTVRQA